MKARSNERAFFVVQYLKANKIWKQKKPDIFIRLFIYD